MRLFGKLTHPPQLAALAGTSSGPLVPIESGQVRATGRTSLAPRLLRGTPGRAVSTSLQSRLSFRTFSFIALVLMPAGLAADYYFAVAANQYVAEFRFNLSTSDPPRLDTLSQMAGFSMQSPAALEAQVLVQYIKSRAIVDDLDQSLDLRHLFSSPQADWWSRFQYNAPIEELVHYWQQQVDPFYDPSDGTVTVQVRAFAPADALRLAQAIDAACEKLANACRCAPGAKHCSRPEPR